MEAALARAPKAVGTSQVGFGATEMRWVWALLAAVLSLGKVTVEQPYP